MEKVQFKYSLNIALNVRNASQAIQFYQKTLGLGLVSLHEEGDCGIEMSAGPLALWIDECASGEEEHVGKVFFEFEANNLDLAKIKLESDGGKVLKSTEGKDFLGFMVEDPFGMRFHVFQKKIHSK